MEAIGKIPIIQSPLLWWSRIGPVFGKECPGSLGIRPHWDSSRTVWISAFHQWHPGCPGIQMNAAQDSNFALDGRSSIWNSAHRAKSVRRLRPSLLTLFSQGNRERKDSLAQLEVRVTRIQRFLFASSERNQEASSFTPGCRLHSLARYYENKKE